MITDILVGRTHVFHRGATTSAPEGSVSDGTSYSALPDPVDVLAQYAIDEYRAGRTVSLEDFARGNNIRLDDE
jgi:hypothetical protein